MSITYLGQCCCGDVGVQLSMTVLISDLEIRECQCEYCRACGGAYLSHPEGSLKISTAHDLIVEKQGSRSVTMLRCSKCNQLIAAALMTESGLIGTVTAHLFDSEELSSGRIPTTPARLSLAERTARWKELWMPTAIVESGQNRD